MALRPFSSWRVAGDPEWHLRARPRRRSGSGSFGRVGLHRRMKVGDTTFKKVLAKNTKKKALAFGPNNLDRGLYFRDGFFEVFPPKVSGVVLPNESVRIRVTRKGSTGQMKIHLDGVKKLAFKDESNKYTLRKGVIVLFQDDGGADASGTTSTVRLWKRVVAP